MNMRKNGIGKYAMMKYAKKNTKLNILKTTKKAMFLKRIRVIR